MILVIYVIAKYCSRNVRLSQKNARDFHIATIKWLIVLIPVLIPDCLSNIYLLEVEIYSDHWMKKTLNKYWSINRNVFYFIVLQFYFYTIKIKYKHAA